MSKEKELELENALMLLRKYPEENDYISAHLQESAGPDDYEDNSIELSEHYQKARELLEKAMADAWLVMDGRIAMLAMKENTFDLNKLDEDWDRMIHLMGSLKECVKAINNGDYGDSCVLANFYSQQVHFEYARDNKWHTSPMVRVEFTGCKFLDYKPNYNGCKRQIMDNEKMFWLRNTNPSMVQFCTKRGRLNFPDACHTEAKKQCNDYEEFTHKIDLPLKELES